MPLEIKASCAWYAASGKERTRQLGMVTKLAKRVQAANNMYNSLFAPLNCSDVQGVSPSTHPTFATPPTCPYGACTVNLGEADVVAGFFPWTDARAARHIQSGRSEHSLCCINCMMRYDRCGDN